MNKLYSSDVITTKIPFIACAVCLSMFIILLRLGYLQLYCGTDFLVLSKKNYERTQEIISVRGDILDCNGLALATNQPVTNIFWKGTGNRSLKPEQLDLLQHVEKIMDISLTTDQLREIRYREKIKKKLLLASDVNMTQLSTILEYYGNHPNISIETNFKRFYPYKTVACHILGYIGQMHNDTGKMGLEKIFDEMLRGNAGLKRITINSLGTPLVTEEIEQAHAGDNITTTLDISLQMIAEYLFPAHRTGSFLLMNPKTGELKAVLSRPHFDPNLFANPLSYTTWQELQTKKPFINRAFYACYPPGSIFKLVTTAAALEEHLIQPNDVYDCKGYITLGDRNYYCMKHTGHGRVTVPETLALSCNSLFYIIGQQLSVDKIAEYAQRFGLGLPTDLVLPEKQGLIPTTLWKQETHKERWWPGETLSVAIGQSYVLSTPLQIARMMSAIFEGYLTNPRILISEPIIKKPLAISDTTRTFLQDSMRLVVTRGTGKSVNTIGNITIWAKTGTAQTSDRQRRKLGKQYDEYAWFVGYFHYKNYDPLTMVILIEQAPSSREATTLAKQFLMQYRAFMQQKEKSTIIIPQKLPERII